MTEDDRQEGNCLKEDCIRRLRNVDVSGAVEYALLTILLDLIEERLA